MRNEYLDLREKFYFKTIVADFEAVCQRYVRQYASEWAAAAPKRKKEIEWIIGNLAIDAMSYIPDWKFKKTGGNAEGALKAGYAILTEQLKAWGAEDQLSETKKEVWELQNSNLIRVSRANDLGLLNTPIGTDAAWDLVHSSRHGTCIATTNPVMVDTVRGKYPEVWNPVRDEIAKNHPNASNEEKVEIFTLEVIKYNCKVLMPIFECTDERVGYVHMQGNPNYAKDSVKMAEEAEYAYHELEKYFGKKPNIIFKIPAVSAARATIERLVAQGICVTVTACASVSQHKVFAETMKNGKAKLQLVVMMTGRFDDPIIEELKAAGLSAEEAVALGRTASTAVINRTYAMLHNDLKIENVWLLVASMRVIGNIEAVYNDHVQPTFLSIFPPQAEEYESILRPVSPGIGRPYCEEALNKLLALSDTFRKGYEYDAMTAEEFDDYLCVTATMAQFRKRYNDTVEYLNEKK
ncbi:MAG: hypothetical protein LBN26_08865 [Christensenellaceae bacterium]|jgi:transaldolase|nr:hypothetical protein [Christensenellaceae bacterium]